MFIKSFKFGNVDKAVVLNDGRFINETLYLNRFAFRKGFNKPAKLRGTAGFYNPRIELSDCRAYELGQKLNRTEQFKGRTEHTNNNLRVWNNELKEGKQYKKGTDIYKSGLLRELSKTFDIVIK